MADRNNLLRATKFRERIELFLQAAGVPVRVRPPRARISEAFGDDAELSASDIKGLSRWTVSLRSDFRHNWAEELEKAERMAEQDGRPFGAVVGYRVGGKLAGEQYALMSLSSFAEVLRMDANGSKP